MSPISQIENTFEINSKQTLEQYKKGMKYALLNLPAGVLLSIFFGYIAYESFPFFENIEGNSLKFIESSIRDFIDLPLDIKATTEFFYFLSAAGILYTKISIEKILKIDSNLKKLTLEKENLIQQILQKKNTQI